MPNTLDNSACRSHSHKSDDYQPWGRDDDVTPREPTSRREHTPLSLHPELVADAVNVLTNKAKIIATLGALEPWRASSRELFDLQSIEFEVDPEEPDSLFLVFNVAASGDLSEISARRREWHRRTRGFLGSAADFVRLIIDVRN